MVCSTQGLLHYCHPVQWQCHFTVLPSSYYVILLCCHPVAVSYYCAASIVPDFRITPVKSGFNTVRLHWSKTGICLLLTLEASLGLIIFTVLIPKSEKFDHGNSLVSSDITSGLRPSGVSDDSPESPREIFPDNPYGLSTVSQELFKEQSLKICSPGNGLGTVLQDIFLRNCSSGSVRYMCLLIAPEGGLAYGQSD